MSNFLTRLLPSLETVGSKAVPLPKTAKILGQVVDVCVHLALFLVPLFFTTFTVDTLELSKQTLLVVLAGIALIAWLGAGLAEKRFSLSRNWIHLVVGLFGLGYLVVSLFSQDRYLSLAGNLGQMPWAFATIAAFVLLYMVMVQRVRTTTQVYNLVFTFLASSLLVALYGLLQMFGWYIVPGDVTHTLGFTSIGSVFALAVYLVVPLVIAATLAFHGCHNNVCVLGSKSGMGKAAQALLWATVAASLLVLIIVDFWVAWAALLFGTLLSVAAGYYRTRKLGKPVQLIVPGVLVVVSVALLFLKSPINLNMPAEVAPSALASWSIAKQALQAHPIFGSGPGTWMFDYAKYRVQLVNLSPFWNVRFDRAFSTFFTLLATTGIVGIALWMILLLSVLVKGIGHLMHEKNEDVWFAYLIVFGGWATMAFLSFFYNFNMAHQLAFWMLLALLGGMVTRQHLTWDANKNVAAYGTISTLFVVVAVGGLAVLWLAGQRFVGEVTFAGAVQAFRSNATTETVIAKVVRAGQLNPLTDLYPRNLSQAYLIKVSNVLQGRPDQDKLKQVQGDVKAAVDSALLATQLSPSNVDDWSNLALIYQSVASFTRGADEFAIKNYQQAHTLEPQNPEFLNEIGRLYLLRSEAYRTLLGSADAAANADAQKNVDDNLNLAQQTLLEALAAKPDYLPARYHLGIVYERQGKLRESIGELENVLSINNKDVGVGFELAILYYRNNQKDQAVNLLAQVVQMDPSNVNAHWYLSFMYEERGKTQEALNEVKAIAESMKDNTAVQQRIQALTAALANKAPTRAQPLPEPIKEPVQSPPATNPVQR